MVKSNDPHWIENCALEEGPAPQGDAHRRRQANQREGAPRRGPFEERHGASPRRAGPDPEEAPHEVTQSARRTAAAQRVIFNGEQGTRWINDTGVIQYQFVCSRENTYGACLPYHLEIRRNQRIPLHFGCISRSAHFSELPPSH